MTILICPTTSRRNRRAIFLSTYIYRRIASDPAWAGSEQHIEYLTTEYNLSVENFNNDPDDDYVVWINLSHSALKCYEYNIIDANTVETLAADGERRAEALDSNIVDKEVMPLIIRLYTAIKNETAINRLKQAYPHLFPKKYTESHHPLSLRHSKRSFNAKARRFPAAGGGARFDSLRRRVCYLPS